MSNTLQDTTMPPRLPDWLELRRGSAPLLLFAPHGGRRLSERRPGSHKVNDLHTAELTQELGARTGATSLVNATRDRNELDLNRVDQIRRRAPWLLTFLAEELEAMLERAARATFLVIHGWNVVQAVCDVGVGLIERDGDYHPAGEGHPTASGAFVTSTLGALKRRAAEAGILVTIGSRYPAANPNNLLQLFTAARRDDADPTVRRLAELSASGRLDAAQLELGIPLRWHGAERNTFTSALLDVLTDWSQKPDAAQIPADTLCCRERIVTRRGLQFVDGELLGMTSIDAAADASIAGRLLLSPYADRLLLFTGELARRDQTRWSLPRLRYLDERDGAWRVSYDGALLDFRTLTPFLDLERGLAEAALVPSRVDLLFRPDPPTAGALATDATGTFDVRRHTGTLTGSVLMGNTHVQVSAPAISTEAPPSPPARLPSLRLTLHSARNALLGLRSCDGERSSLADSPPTRSAGAAAAAIDGGRFTFDLAADSSDDRQSVVGRCDITLGSGSGRVCLEMRNGQGEKESFEGTLERLIPVRRPGRAGTVVLTVYALCRFPDRHAGWLELVAEEPRRSDQET